MNKKSDTLTFETFKEDKPSYSGTYVCSTFVLIGIVSFVPHTAAWSPHLIFFVVWFGFFFNGIIRTAAQSSDFISERISADPERLKHSWRYADPASHPMEIPLTQIERIEITTEGSPFMEVTTAAEKHLYFLPASVDVARLQMVLKEKIPHALKAEPRPLSSGANVDVYEAFEQSKTSSMPIFVVSCFPIIALVTFIQRNVPPLIFSPLHAFFGFWVILVMVWIYRFKQEQERRMSHGISVTANTLILAPPYNVKEVVNFDFAISEIEELHMDLSEFRWIGVSTKQEKADGDPHCLPSNTDREALIAFLNSINPGIKVTLGK